MQAKHQGVGHLGNIHQDYASKQIDGSFASLLVAFSRQ